MKQELTKQIVKVGNSAGIILPKEWLNGKARVKLITKPLNIKKEVLEILEQYLQNIKGVYLVGSYARGEQTQRSDVDILVITDKISKKIEFGKYYILLIPIRDLEDVLQNNALPILSMLKEARPIINKELISKYENTQLTKKSLKSYIELTKSALSIDREMIKLDKEWPSNCSSSVAYSLILHLRTVYIIDRLRKSKIWSNKELINIIIKLSGSSKAYEEYLRVKDGKKERERLPTEEAEKIYLHIIKQLGEIERWLKGKKG